MKNWVRHGLLVLVLLSVAACASGPKYAEMQNTIPQLQKQEGRVFFYREASPIGAAIQPDIKLNDKVLGQSVPGGFFYTDVAAGNCEVSCETEVEKKLSFTLDPGQVRYVKTEIGLGLLVGRVQPYLVDEAEGLKAVQELSYQAPKK